MAVRALAAGVDTWAPSWRVLPDTPLARQLEEQATIPSAQGGRLVPYRVAEHKVIYWPASGLLKAEGHPQPEGLAPIASLPSALVELTAAMTEAGVPPPPGGRRFRRFRDSEGFAGLRRCDLTVDLRVDDQDEGRRLMAAVEAAARSTGWHAPTYLRRGKPGHTVYQRGDRGVHSRWYDKGAESGRAAPYRWIRPEAQWNFRHDEAAPDDVDLDDVDWMRERFRKRWPAAYRTRIVIGDMSDLGRELARAVRENRMTPAEARRVGGYLLTEPFGGLQGDSRATRFRLRAEAAAFGFHLVDGVLEPLEYDLHDAVAEAERDDLWRSGSIGHIEPPDESVEYRREMARKLSEARPDSVPAPPAKSTDQHWRDARGRRTDGPARQRPLRDQLDEPHSSD